MYLSDIEHCVGDLRMYVQYYSVGAIACVESRAYRATYGSKRAHNARRVLVDIKTLLLKLQLLSANIQWTYGHATYVVSCMCPL